MSDLESQKAAAAIAAVSEIESGMLIGLGTGSTTAYAIREIGRLTAEGLRIRAVATSVATEKLATSLGISIEPFDALSYVDLAIDGADEVDKSLRAIKGGGGALLREKIVASASKRMIVVVDSSKPVQTLGRFKLPVEVLPFAVAWVEESLQRLGAITEQRRKSDGTPFLTDQNNTIIDAGFSVIPNPEELAEKLNRIPGLLEHGLFLTEIDALYIGHASGVDVVRKPQS